MISALVYDLEIVRAIPEKGVPRVEGIEYCAGWGDYANMGISVVCAYDYLEERYRVFTQGNLGEFAQLASERQVLVSFNGLAFDNQVLAAHVTAMPSVIRCYDLLWEVWQVVGRRVKGYRLDDLAAANLGIRKTGDGALAPVWWQQGQYGRVIDYCLQDVRITKLLFDRVRLGGELRSPVTGEMLRLWAPVAAAGEAAAAE